MQDGSAISCSCQDAGPFEALREELEARGTSPQGPQLKRVLEHALKRVLVQEQLDHLLEDALDVCSFFACLVLFFCWESMTADFFSQSLPTRATVYSFELHSPTSIKLAVTISLEERQEEPRPGEILSFFLSLICVVRPLMSNSPKPEWSSPRRVVSRSPCSLTSRSQSESSSFCVRCTRSPTSRYCRLCCPL